MKITKILFAAILVFGIAFLGTTAMAEEGGVVHVVEMLNKGEEGTMVFKPAVIYANVGDTIQFKPTKPGHNAQSYKKMVPEGGTAFRTKMNKVADIVVDAEGMWAYNCMPHEAMGMVGLIIVGEEVDVAGFELIGRTSPMAKKRFDLYLADPLKYSNKASEVPAE